jgi:hypothetical protein
MSLRVRCPHCKATLVAADEQAGLPGNCSECGRRFIMPLPVAETAKVRASVATKCVRCRADLAPGTAVCPRCATNQASGERLSPAARLRRLSVRAWTITAASALLIGLTAWTVVEVWRNWSGRTVAPPVSGPSPVAGHPNVDGLAERLFAARSPAERKQAADAIIEHGTASVTPLLERLARVSVTERDPQAIFNAERAIDLVAKLGGPANAAALRDLPRIPLLKADVTRARAMLADATVSADAAALWTDLARKRMFFERLSKLAPAEAASADRTAVSRAGEAADRVADGLRVLAQLPESTIVGTLLETLFSSWSWLGQQRDERYSAEIWDAAKPPRDADADFRHRVRAARRVLDRTSQTASAGARAAAGLVLANSGPQYESLRKEIISALAAQLSECPPVDQQRLTWTLARLAGQRFGDISDRSAPQDVERTTVLAALDWARTSGIANPPPLRTARESYPPPPLPALRVVTAERQLEQALLREIDAGWPTAEKAADRWVAARLGLTPRLNERLDPAHHEPKLAAVAAAMLIAAESNAVTARTRLEVWSKAADQPVWLRGFAGTALAVLDARGGRSVERWPGDLSPAVFEFGPDRPSANQWGRLISAGGAEILDRLRKDRRVLPLPIRDTLLRAAEQAAARNRKGA